jgi:hypothetical protein
VREARLRALGVRVVHILGADELEEHRLAPPARLVGGELSYELESRDG